MGITYDPKDDLIDLDLDGIDHLVYKPRELYVENGLNVANLEIDAVAVVEPAPMRPRDDRSRP
jgi:Family of unknown function (DUF5335)